MGRYLIRRSLQLIFTLWVVSVLTFLIFVKLPPGDPAIRLAGKQPRPEQLAAIHKREYDKWGDVIRKNNIKVE